MKLASKFGLWLGRRLPRGYWRIIQFVARRDSALWDFRIPLTYAADAEMRADLREPIFTGYLRAGCIPHQRGEDQLFKKLMESGDRVFDVGANVGYVTMLASWIVGQEGLVVAFEPSRRAQKLLERNTADMKNVIRVSSAVSVDEGTASFFETSTLDTSSLEPISISDTNSYCVQTISLDQAAANWGSPNFVKIDVERHEHDVFRGMRTILSSEDKPIIMFEALTLAALQTSCRLLLELSEGNYDVRRVLQNGKVGSLDHEIGTSNYMAFPIAEQSLLHSVLERA